MGQELTAEELAEIADARRARQDAALARVRGESRAKREATLAAMRADREALERRIVALEQAMDDVQTILGELGKHWIRP